MVGQDQVGLVSSHVTSHVTRVLPDVVSYLQVLQVSLLRVTQQRGDPVVVSQAAGGAVLPHGEDLADDCHAPQCTVGKLQDLCVTDFLLRQRGRTTSATAENLCEDVVGPSKLQNI